MITLMRQILLYLLLCFPIAARACLWDSDTIAVEAKGHMDLVRVLTGRFERNPPLYYQMRLERTQRELLTHPEKLELYDDAAVAADRLGNDVLALKIIEKKRKQMESAKLDPKDEHWYRYFANAGTFHAHHAMAGGLKDKKELKLGRDMIAKAIEINPNAHFGREGSQLLVLDWLLDEKAPSLPDYVESRVGRHDRERSLQGFVGLILLGQAWESPDTYAAIANFAGNLRKASISNFAKFRVDELLARGKHLSRIPVDDIPQYWGMYHADKDVRAFDSSEFKRLRTEADKWNSARTMYMEQRLNAGNHPDTDADFWQGYKNSEAPAISNPPFKLQMRNWFLHGGPITLLFSCGGICVALMVFLVWRSRIKARRQAG